MSLLHNLKDVLRNNVLDATDLVLLLGLSIEDLLEAFEDRILDNAELILTSYNLNKLVDIDDVIDTDEEPWYDPSDEDE
jgi:hypothetical protein